MNFRWYIHGLQKYNILTFWPLRFYLVINFTVQYVISYSREFEFFSELRIKFSLISFVWHWNYFLDWRSSWPFLIREFTGVRHVFNRKLVDNDQPTIFLLSFIHKTIFNCCLIESFIALLLTLTQRSKIFNEANS